MARTAQAFRPAGACDRPDPSGAWRSAARTTALPGRRPRCSSRARAGCWPAPGLRSGSRDWRARQGTARSPESPVAGRAVRAGQTHPRRGRPVAPTDAGRGAPACVRATGRPAARPRTRPTPASGYPTPCQSACPARPARSGCRAPTERDAGGLRSLEHVPGCTAQDRDPGHGQQDDAQPLRERLGRLTPFGARAGHAPERAEPDHERKKIAADGDRDRPVLRCLRGAERDVCDTARRSLLRQQLDTEAPVAEPCRS